MRATAIKRLWRKLVRSCKKIFRKKRARYGVPFVATAILIGAVTMYPEPAPTRVNPASYTALLTTIAKGESRGNYNAYFGNATNQEINFTQMTVADVLRWQQEYVQGGSPSSAVGKYQIVRPTLNGLVQQLNIGLDEKFDASLQDRMAIALLERRGSVSFVENKISREQFAANLSQEWAALPKVIGDNPSLSYYAGDGLNKSSIGVDEVLDAVGRVQKL